MNILTTNKMAGNTRWSVNETEILKTNYGLMPVEDLAARLRRSVDAVHWKASKEGLRFVRDANFALNKKLDRIIASIDAINKRIDKMEEKIEPRPAESKEQFVMNHYRTMSRKEIADALGVKVGTITSIMSRCGLRRYKNSHK